MAYLPSVVVAIAGFVVLVSGVRQALPLLCNSSNVAANQRSCNWLAQSHTARLDTVQDGVVPVSVEPCDFGVGVETQNVAVGCVRPGPSLQSHALLQVWARPFQLGSRLYSRQQGSVRS